MLKSFWKAYLFINTKNKNRVQYELKIKDEWYQVVRYDTAHGFAHKDIVPYKRDTQKETLPFNDYNLALTFAEKDLRDNWQKYREQYLKETEKND